MINQWKIAENGGVGKSVPEKCKTPQSFTLKCSEVKCDIDIPKYLLRMLNLPSSWS